MNKGLVLKLLALGIMALILVSALGRVESKVKERRATRDAAVAGIALQYAEAQQVAGPLLWLSCIESRSVTRLDEKQRPRVETETTDCSRLVRPARLAGEGGITVSERYRGIYKARVYVASLRLNARFDPVKPDLKPNQSLKGAYWIFSVSDPRGLKEIAIKDGSGKTLRAQPGTLGSPLPKGFHVPVAIDSLTREQALSADIELAGSGRIEWVPVAGDNEFSLRSAWPHPDFSGRYLPDTREISSAGFKANWRVNAFATGGNDVLETATPAYIEPASYYEAPTQTARFSHGFGVSLIDPVDAYVQSDRAIRYGFLFVLLTLGGFYLFELLKQKTLHPLQYLMIGFAVVVFFLLLLALSEHLGFLLAYVIAASACTALIAAYGRTLLGNWKASAALGAGYGALFGGLYQLLASEDHALLMGAWLVFGVLAATMYLTRKLDWQGIGRAPQAATNPAFQSN